MTVPEMFGENVFNLDVMREKLPKGRVQIAEEDHRRG